MIQNRGLVFTCLVVFIASTRFLTVIAQECNEDVMRNCKRSGLDTIDSSNRQTNRNDINSQCRTLRENFDCILWQTAMCQDKDGQDDNKDSIVRIWRYLQSFCESQGSWYTKQCFQRDDVRRCESLLPSRGNNLDTSSCRSFASFRNCVTAIVEIDCSTSDQKLLGSYLMEKGLQRAWNCPRDQNDLYPASAPLAADTDPRYTSLADTSYGYCSDQARSELQECRSDFSTSQRDAQTHNDNDMRHHKTCCAMVHYENCVEEKLQDRCGDRGRSEARTIVAEMKQRFPYQSCGDHGLNECSAATITTASLILCVTLFMASRFTMFKF